MAESLLHLTTKNSTSLGPIGIERVVMEIHVPERIHVLGIEAARFSALESVDLLGFHLWNLLESWYVVALCRHSEVIMLRKHKRRHEKLIMRIHERRDPKYPNDDDTVYSEATWPGDLNKSEGTALRNGNEAKWGKADKLTWEIYNYSSHDVNVKIVEVKARPGSKTDKLFKDGTDFDEDVDGRDGQDPPEVDDLTVEFDKDADGAYDYKIRVLDKKTGVIKITDDGRATANGPDIEIY